MSSVKILFLCRVEIGDGANYAILVCPSELRVDWQRQHLLTRFFRFGKSALFVTEIGECRLQMKRAWVVNIRRDAIRLQIRTEFISLPAANHELVVHMHTIRSGGWQNH